MNASFVIICLSLRISILVFFAEKVSFLQYYFKEITHGHFMDKNDPRYLGRRERVYTFLKQPFEIEKVCEFFFKDQNVFTLKKIYIYKLLKLLKT